MPADDWVLRLVRSRYQLSREHDVTSQRVQLIDAMARAVAEKGYARASVADITAHAGVSEQVFREQFQDMESCFLATYDLGVEVLATAVEDDLGPPDRPPLERFERVLVGYLDLLASEPSFARTSLIEIYAAGPRAVQRRIENLRRYATLFAEIFGPPEEGGLDDFACEAIVGAISTLVTTRVAAGAFDQLPALREPIVELVKRLLATGPTPPAGFEPATRGLEGPTRSAVQG
jgi:AcrR family transcriptional regulator